MLLSINKLAQILRMDRQTIKRRLDMMGFEPQNGPKGAHLYSSDKAISVATYTTDNCSEANVMRAQINGVIDKLQTLKISASAKRQVEDLIVNALTESDRICDRCEDSGIADQNAYD